MTASLCLTTVGVVFLVAGLIKALDCHPFIRQLAEYRIIKHPWHLRMSALAFVGVEWFFGAALAVQLAPWIVPASIAILLLLAGLTAWAAITRRVANCGCYGGLLLLTPIQSVFLDILYIVMLGVGWWLTSDHPADWPFVPPVWKIARVAAATAGGVLLAKRSLWAPIYEFVLLKPGKSWRRDWLKEYPEIATTPGPFYLVFLSPDCPYCKNWVPLLNIIHVEPDLPRVLGIMSLTGTGKEEFQKQHVIHFPIAYMHESAASMMIKAFPTAIWVENNKIKEKWVGEMPRILLERLHGFYKAIAAPPSRTKVFGG